MIKKQKLQDDVKREETKKHLTELAKELAINYLHSSQLDLIAEDDEERLRQNKEHLKSNVLNGVDSIDNYTRNILVIGAGCTYNIHKDVPLARDAIKRIHEKIKFGDLSFNQLIKKERVKKEQEDNNIDSSKGKSKENLSDDVLLEDALADKYWDEFKKLKLHSSDYGNTVDTDFETSLNLLSKILPVSTIRGLIQDIYKHKYGPILFYEIVAHLFKHRFIDAIINFNFDEFLDLSIQEELGRDGYDAILSDGDCQPLAELAQAGRLRQPLYIKPHGTASHKSTLRFTKNQYYELPLDMREFLVDLISCRNDKPTRTVNLITVGFEMNSIEFNDILKNHLPKGSKIFSFYFHDPSKTLDSYMSPIGKELHMTAKVMTELREKHLNHVFPNRDEQELTFRYIGHEFFDGKGDSYFSGADYQFSLGNTFHVLHKQIKAFYNKPYQPRRLSRHFLLSDIFGSRVFLDQFKDEPKGRYDYFTSEEYFSDRLLIELLTAIAVNKGIIDLPLLMMGRVGRYYSLYHKCILEKSDDKRKSNGKGGHPALFRINDFAEFFYEEAHVVNRFNESPAFPNEGQIYDYAEMKLSEQSVLVSDKLSWFFANLDSHSELRYSIRKNFKNLHNSNRSNIKSELRGTIHHIFDDYRPTNLLNTDLSLDLHYDYSLREDSEINTVLMVAEYGIQLSKFLPKILENGIKVQLLLADKEPEKEPPSKIALIKQLHEKYKSSRDEAGIITDLNINTLHNLIDIKLLEANRHNHHMSVFLKMLNKDEIDEAIPKGENRAIYYYQPGRDLNINPIRILELENVKVLKRKFDYYWNLPATRMVL